VTAVLDVLRGAKAVIERNGWHQGTYYDARLQLEQPESAAADCPVCLYGAFNLASGAERPDKDMPWADAAAVFVEDEVLRNGRSIANWNDRPDRTLPEVLALLDEAIARAEAVSS
jgi:hypothetical protein